MAVIAQGYDEEGRTDGGCDKDGTPRRQRPTVLEKVYSTRAIQRSRGLKCYGSGEPMGRSKAEGQKEDTVTPRASVAAAADASGYERGKKKRINKPL